jgi:integrase/recombinase XerD
LGNHPLRKRVLALKTHRRQPRALTEDEVAAVIAACEHLRDRFLFTLLRSAGLRIGEALGLRHEDISPRRCEISIRSRNNANHARAKTSSRVVPVPEHVISLYADYLHDEYGDLDSDYVFVNLWAQPIGRAMSYSAVHALVASLRERTGVMFSSHAFRGSSILKGQL